MGINQTWCVIPIIFVSTASIHNARLFDIYDVRSPFIGEVHAIPPSCFVPSSVYRWGDHCAMPPVSPAIMHLAGVALVVLPHTEKLKPSILLAFLADRWLFQCNDHLSRHRDLYYKDHKAPRKDHLIPFMGISIYAIEIVTTHYELTNDLMQYSW